MSVLAVFRTRIGDRIDPQLHEAPRFGLDSELWRTHAHGMKQLITSATIGLIAIAAVAAADAIQKWRTPDGSFYFGDRPPTGSTLLDTYPDTPAPPASVGSSDVASLSQAAADGRDIIRRREAERAAEGQADRAREARTAETEPSQVDDFAPFWFITGTVSPCRFGEHCVDGHSRHHDHQHPYDDGTVGGHVHDPFATVTVRPPFRPLTAPPSGRPTSSR